MKRSLVVLIIALLVGGFLANYFIIGGVKVVHPKNDVIDSAINEAMQSTTSYQPIENVDYRVSHINYFDNKSWVVASISPIGNRVDPGKIIFKKDGNSYQKVFGPINFFPENITRAVPADVANFLKGGSS